MRRWIGVLLLAVMAVSGCAASDEPATAKKGSELANAPAPQRRPNIIVIVADDLGYADLGAQGSKDARTPNIDTLAKNGVRFTNGYVSCPVCSPTRAGLLTGRYQQRFGHEFNPGPAEAETFGLPTDQVTLPQVLKGAGYATGMVGKWHLGFRPEMHPQRRGFDEFFGFLAGAHAYNQVGTGRNALLRGETPVEQTDYLTDAFGREASAFVDQHAKGDKPFFLYLAFNAIHTPLQAPAKYLARFPDEKDPKRQTMLAMLSAMDDAVGSVLEKLRAHQLEENTLIFFTSDNGGPTPGNGSRNDPLRGTKGQVLEGGIRVAQMMQWKGRLPAGKIYERPVIALDIFPTALAAAGTSAPPNVKLDGVNLLPFLERANDRSPHETLYWRVGQQWAIRDGNHKLVRTRGGGSPQLFDLAADIGEQNDLAGAQPAVARRLRDKYEQWSSEVAQPKWRDSRDERRGGGGEAGRGRRRQRAAATQKAD